MLFSHFSGISYLVQIIFQLPVENLDGTHHGHASGGFLQAAEYCTMYLKQETWFKTLSSISIGIYFTSKGLKILAPRNYILMRITFFTKLVKK